MTVLSAGVDHGMDSKDGVAKGLPIRINSGALHTFPLDAGGSGPRYMSLGFTSRFFGNGDTPPLAAAALRFSRSFFSFAALICAAVMPS